LVNHIYFSKATLKLVFLQELPFGVFPSSIVSFPLLNHDYNHFKATVRRSRVLLLEGTVIPPSVSTVGYLLIRFEVVLTRLPG
jgi:hypothetical protein